MEDGDTESYQVSRVIQDSVFFYVGKWVVSMVIFDRYIIRSFITTIGAR